MPQLLVEMAQPRRDPSSKFARERLTNFDPPSRRGRIRVCAIEGVCDSNYECIIAVLPGGMGDGYRPLGHHREVQ